MSIFRIKISFLSKSLNLQFCRNLSIRVMILSEEINILKVVLSSVNYDNTFESFKTDLKSNSY